MPRAGRAARRPDRGSLHPRPHTGKEEKGLPHTPSKEKKYIYNYPPESVSLSGVNARERHSQG